MEYTKEEEEYKNARSLAQIEAERDKSRSRDPRLRYQTTPQMEVFKREIPQSFRYSPCQAPMLKSGWTPKEAMDVIRLTPDEDNIAYYSRVMINGATSEFDALFKCIMETKYVHLVNMAITKYKPDTTKLGLPIVTTCNSI